MGSARDMRFSTGSPIEAARLAVVLAREDGGLYRSADQIAQDAVAILKAGARARRALLSQAEPDPLADIQGLAAEYRAELVRGLELPGMALGLRLTSGRVDIGCNSIYFIK